jgi:oxygen-dependent protoporphyrinogen oxidase
VTTATGETFPADAVVVAVPPDGAARALQPLDGELGDLLGQIEIAPVAVTMLGFESAGLGHEVDGFGFLVPRGGGVRLLGCLWSSSIFPGRAPRGHVLMRCIAGGALDPTLMELDDDGVVEAMREDLRRSMGITARPTFVRVVRWPRGIPQYNIGHVDRVARIDRAAARHPGLFLTGNALRGVAFNACIDEAPRVAERVLRFLGGD